MLPETSVTRRTRSPWLAVLALAAAGCVPDGPTAVSGARTVTLAALPRFAAAPSASVVAALDVARLQLIDTQTGDVVDSIEQPIDPSLVEWTFAFTLQLLEDQVLNLRLDIELIDGDPAVDVVEFAGRTEFDVQASFAPTEIREINLGRGPLENLSITDLRLLGPRPKLQEGGSQQLVLDTVGARAGQKVFFESMDPTLATVDSAGRIAALVPGTAMIIAQAGRKADTLNLTVGEVDLPAANVLQTSLVPQSDYVIDDRFLSSLEDAAAANELRESLELLIADMLAGRGFEAVGRFEETQALWEGYGEGTNLRFLDGPQLGVIAITLLHAAEDLGIEDFP